MRFDDPLLRTQHGVYHQSQARDLGLRRSGNGCYPGVRVLPGVWSLLPAPLPQSARLWAALLYAGPFARLTGVTAAALLGWRTPVALEDVRVAVPNARKVSSRSFIVIVRTRLGTTMTRLGLSVADPEWLLADCAQTLADRELTAVVATALARREVALRSICDLTAAHPHVPGVVALRACVRQLAGGAESIREVDTLSLIRKLGFPPPECQVWLYDEVGSLVAVADFYWEGVAGFYDGGDHFGHQAQKSDRHKRDRLEALGLQVPIVTSSLLAAPGLFKQRISAAHEAAAALALTRAGPPRWRAVSASRVRPAS